MKINWIIEEEDIRHIKEFVDSQSGKSFVKNRIAKNVNGHIPDFNRDILWNAMISCLLTTQQRSGPESSVTKFICINPFPLNLNRCAEQTNLKKFVEGTITNFGGLRRAKTIGDEVLHNFKWLKNGGWQEIESIAKVLVEKRGQSPQFDDKYIERKAAKIAIDNLKGFGPKQARNLWQSLGLTRFEIPIDSRITKWFNQNGFPLRLSAGALSDENYYNFVMDGIQEACNASDAYPCVLDAAIFASFDQEWPEDKLIW
ncbi:hypothetical protein [Thermodesulfovibrio thiophilus]|uniref:hypothetical protein n=1 Tax=Thermodesulfovibrio thiophilus TaxID=340095 RepID=UPI00179AFD0B|nr:hypothetical protein [Thermodesulfovibrio thiophilus]HHW20519.1 hypothetical protein [Thermodesulfovibrio thiophilus]